MTGRSDGGAGRGGSEGVGAWERACLVWGACGGICTVDRPRLLPSAHPLAPGASLRGALSVHICSGSSTGGPVPLCAAHGLLSLRHDLLSECPASISPSLPHILRSAAHIYSPFLLRYAPQRPPRPEIARTVNPHLIPASLLPLHRSSLWLRSHFLVSPVSAVLPWICSGRLLVFRRHRPPSSDPLRCPESTGRRGTSRRWARAGRHLPVRARAPPVLPLRLPAAPPWSAGPSPAPPVAPAI